MQIGPAILLIISIFFGLKSAAQTAKISGRVKDHNGQPLAYANILVSEQGGTNSNEDGYYSIQVKSGIKFTLTASFVGFEKESRSLSLKEGQEIIVNFSLNPSFKIDTTIIRANRYEGTGTVKIDPKHLKVIASVGDPVISLVKSQLGVNSNSELGSGYSVRGGSFDENLIYINDVEVYRPFLARSGQQEGLSFINGDMISEIAFSSGGFEARYGDKMSSVLNITYKKPTKLEYGGNVGLLGGSAYLQTPLFHQRVKLNLGGRYRSNNYLFRFMDTRGEYKPTFYDFQGNMSILAHEKLDISVLGIYSSNTYNFFPSSRETSFGTAQQTFKFEVDMGGQEITRFRTGMGAVSFDYKPIEDLSLKLIGSYTSTKESERLDIQGRYILGELDNNLASETYSEISKPIGSGGFMNHARNFLNADILAVDLKGIVSKEKYNLRWGLQYKNERIDDRLKEWNMTDSASFALPYYGPQDSQAIQFNDVLKTNIQLLSHRFSAYMESTFRWKTKDSTRIHFNAGLRAQWWSVNQEWLISPRLLLSVIPQWNKADIIFRASAGVYYQAPFYRELRGLDGSINEQVKAQRSIMGLVGMDYYFKIWKRPFKLTAEAYYKNLANLNPYELDNIRIRYYAQNNAKGFAYGVDAKINGEFIPGVESWLTLSFMQTKEDIIGDYYYRYLDVNGDPIFPGSNVPAADSVMVEPGYIPRPTDQRFTFSLFFQDNLPKIPQVKVSLNLVLGTGWPYGPPSQVRYTDTLRMPFYRRVDMGFLYEIICPDIKHKNLRLERAKKHISRAALSLEIYNIFGINNTVSYNWIRDYQMRYYGVPNYLTPRLFNFKFTIDLK